jgi:hypothetical protein
MRAFVLRERAKKQEEQRSGLVDIEAAYDLNADRRLMIAYQIGDLSPSSNSVAAIALLDGMDLAQGEYAGNLHGLQSLRHVREHTTGLIREHTDAWVRALDENVDALINEMPPFFDVIRG